MNTTHTTVGDVLRQWRQRRNLSQLDLSNTARVSPRHLSFIESGRSQASRDMLLRLADALDTPLRARNALLLAGGYAPAYPEHSFDDPGLASIRRAVDLLLSGHEPYPALVVDRGWNLVTANLAAFRLLDGIAPALLEPPVNMLRICFHPDGIAPRLRNRESLLPQLIARLDHEILVTADERLVDLRDELVRYPSMANQRRHRLTQPGIVLQ
ncbi:MAG TPA: helix-turn-helix transcriptional regulator, partial [Thermomicrobiales bacterium]|nr:helix-turn-helix transcriptional regulator [Thermomicrobiales bacterium]